MIDAPAIEVEHLRKSYGSLVAVDDISFQVCAGEILTLVGPNGAGKTTTIECVEGLRQPDSGSVRVLGLDPRKDRYLLRSRVGMQLQESTLQPNLKVWEACDLFAAFYPRIVDWRSLLERLGLWDKRNSAFGKLSGGQKQRLQMALALLMDPEVVFLDEITTGLDPQARRSIWDLVLEIKDRGKAILLTTHYMEEAARLSDRVAIIDGGRIVALDTPSNLVRELDVGERVSFTISGPEPFDPEPLTRLPGVARVALDSGNVVVYGTGKSLVVDVVTALVSAGIHFEGLTIEKPSLEDVFLARTGKRMRTEEGGDGS